MKITWKLIFMAAIIVSVGLSSCELFLEDNAAYNYTGLNSSLSGVNRRLTINNKTNGSNITYAYLIQTASSTKLSDDLLGPNMIKAERSNLIYGVPALQGRIQMTFGAPASADVIYGSGPTFLDFTINDYTITVSINPGDYSALNMTPDPYTQIVEVNGVQYLITAIPD